MECNSFLMQLGIISALRFVYIGKLSNLAFIIDLMVACSRVLLTHMLDQVNVKFWFMETFYIFAYWLAHINIDELTTFWKASVHMELT